MHRVKIHQGDIQKLAVDAIVSASAAQLSELSMSKAMPAAVGDGRSYSASYRTHYSAGDVVIGAADDLPAGMVIYTVGPTWPDLARWRLWRRAAACVLLSQCDGSGQET